MGGWVREAWAGRGHVTHIGLVSFRELLPKANPEGLVQDEWVGPRTGAVDLYILRKKDSPDTGGHGRESGDRSACACCW